MPTLNEQYAVEEEQIQPIETAGIDYQELERPKPTFDFSSVIEKLKTQTGDGELSEYQRHIFNPSGSKATAQILRGLTGFIGSMNYAVIDIILGFANLKREKASGNSDVAPYSKVFANHVSES